MTPARFSDYFGALNFGSFDSDIQATAKEARYAMNAAADYLTGLTLDGRSTRLINQHNRESERIAVNLAKLAKLTTCGKCGNYRKDAFCGCEDEK